MGGKLPVPDDWDEETGGWNILLACVPDSQKWRAIIEGNFYDLTFWNKWDTSAGSINDAKRIANEIYESIQMACLADITRIADNLERLNNILAGEKSTENDENGDPIWDYRDTGIVPTMREIGIAPVEWLDDLGSVLTGEIPLASIMKTGMIGRRIDILPTLGEGTGLTDLLDEQIDVLHRRFSQSDISLDGTPFTKNITETLETLFRLRGLFDPEFMPNITNVMQDALNISGDVADTFKNTILKQITSRLGLLDSHRKWLEDLITDKDAVNVVDGLLLLLSALQKLDSSTAQIDASTIINLLNGQNCAPGTNGNGTSETSTVTITDQGVKVEGLLEGGSE